MILYENCRELPIHNFFEINRTRNLKYLVKSGEIPSEEVLNEKYIDILDEYNGLFESRNKSKDIVNQSRMMMLNAKLMGMEIIEILIASDGITDEIKAVAKQLRVKPENLKDYISGIKNELKKLGTKLEQTETTENNNADSLEKTLILVKENGFNFDRFTTPVIEFVFAINRLEQKSRMMEARKNKK